MNQSRKKMLERVKAILAKTMENGCTEEEAMTALAKARELMATYEIDEKELNEFDREKAVNHKTAPADPYDIKKQLATNVGKFTRCKAYRDIDKTVNFAGRESDSLFAVWLLDTLQRFTMRALRKHQAALIAKGVHHSNNLTSASFIMGCVDRINEKLAKLTQVDHAKGMDLILKELNLSLSKSRKTERSVHEGSFRAGSDAGAGARFDMPVGAGGRLHLK